MAGSSSTTTAFLLGVLSTLVVVVAALYMLAMPAPSSYGDEIYQQDYLETPPWPIFHFAMWLEKVLAYVPNRVVPPPFRLVDMAFISFQRSALMRSVVKLKVADALWKHGPLPIEKLASVLEVNASFLDRVLLALLRFGLFQQLEDGRYANNKFSALLAEGHPSSLVPYFRWGEIELFKSWAEIDTLIKSGEVMPLEDWWKWVNEDDTRRVTFANFMQSTATWGNQAVVEDYNFCKYSRVIDMGGGTGGLLKLLLAQCPNTKGVIFELPEIAADAERKWKAEFSTLYPRASFIGGSFLESAPAIAANEAFVFRTVLHDWNDERVSTILKHCRESMSKVSAFNSTRLLLVEFFPDQAPGTGVMSQMLDVQMLIIGGQERTVAQWDKLLTQHGFRVHSVTHTRSVITVLEAVPV